MIKIQTFMKREIVRESLANLFLPLGLIFGLILLLSLNAEQSPQAEELRNPLEFWLKVIVGYFAVGAEIAAALVIGGAVVNGMYGYVRQVFSRSRLRMNATELIRLKLGRSLALGLEFTVASDILRTAVAPNRRDILNLGAIVLLRTLLNYFIEREIQQVEQSRSPEEELSQSVD
jgi:uncharacterized membrane protein